MLVSEIRGWHWVITWDNPQPANSSALLNALNGLGHVTELGTKTTVALAPMQNIRPKDIRAAISENMNLETGKVVYVNLRSHKAFQWGPDTGNKWRQVV